MTALRENRRFKPLATAAIAALGLVAVALPLAPAKAQFYFGCGPMGCGVDVGGVGVGVTNPYYYSPYYYRPYYRPYYDPYWP